jgi:hypothetical protein
MANRVAGLLSQLFRYGIHRQIVESSPVQLLFRREAPNGRASEPSMTKSSPPSSPISMRSPSEQAARVSRSG